MVIRWPDPAPAAPRRKYHAEPCELDGLTFASRREANRWAGLRLMERAGVIRGLRRQVRLKLWGIGRDGAPVVVARYVADFTYWRVTEGHTMSHLTPVVEDAKGVRTETYRLKARWFALQFGFFIVEV